MRIFEGNYELLFLVCYMIARCANSFDVSKGFTAVENYSSMEVIQ